MFTYIVVWCDLIGRFHTKTYIYRRCAEKFCVGLVVSGRALDGDVRLASMRGRHYVKCECSVGGVDYVHHKKT